VKTALKYVAIFLLWNLAAGGFLLFTPFPVNLVGALALSGFLVQGYLVRPGRGEVRRWAYMRIRPLPPETLRWTLVGVPVLLLLSWSVGDVYTRFVPVPLESLNPFEAIMRTWQGRLTITVFAIAVAPVIEEFIFRGAIQRIFVRRYGPARGIAVAAGMFAIVHFLPWVLPLHFLLGCAFGYAVWATRSIWAGVILHAANNTAAVVGLAIGDGAMEPTGGFWDVGVTVDLWVSLAALTLALAAAVYVGRGMVRVGRPERLRIRSAPA